MFANILIYKRHGICETAQESIEPELYTASEGGERGTPQATTGLAKLELSSLPQFVFK